MTNATTSVDSGNNGGNFASASAVLGAEDPSHLVSTLCPAGDNAIIGTWDTTGANANEPTWSAFN